MPFQLIPYPISVIFALVFVVAIIAVLWRLRKNGKIYSFLFNASLVGGFLLLVVILYTIITNFLV